MKCFGLFLSLFMLCSCTNGYENHNAINAVNSSVDALEQSLPAQCKTDAINAQFKAIREQTATIERDCTTAIEKVDSERIKWKTAFFGLLLVLGVFTLKKVL